MQNKEFQNIVETADFNYQQLLLTIESLLGGEDFERFKALLIEFNKKGIKAEIRDFDDNEMPDSLQLKDIIWV